MITHRDLCEELLATRRKWKCQWKRQVKRSAGLAKTIQGTGDEKRISRRQKKMHRKHPRMDWESGWTLFQAFNQSPCQKSPGRRKKQVICRFVNKDLF